jgi:hypothetical protein
MEMKQEMLEMLTNSLVEDRKHFKEMQEDVSNIVKRYDGKGIEWNYDEFCVRFINNLKKKKISEKFVPDQLKKLFLDCMVEISIEELEKRGLETESRVIYKILKNKEYDEVQE